MTLKKTLSNELHQITEESRKLKLDIEALKELKLDKRLASTESFITEFPECL